MSTKKIRRMKWDTPKSELKSGYIQEYNEELKIWETINLKKKLKKKIKKKINKICIIFLKYIKNIFKY